MTNGNFPDRMLLALKALSISRGRLAAELQVDKSVVSRWLNGRQAPSGHNLVNLTALVASRRPGFTMLDWESDIDSLARKLGVGEQPPGVPGGPGGWLPEQVLDEALALTARRGADYEGFWRTTRPAIGQPGRFIHDRLMVRKADNGFLTFRLGVEDMRFDGWTFPTQTQLFSMGADAKTGIFIFTIFNAVLRDRAEVMDGLALTVQRIGGGSPVASAALMERTGILSGDAAIDEAAYEASIQQDPIAPEGSVPEHIRARLLPDVGPRAAAEGGAALLHMAFANSLSRSLLPSERA